MIPNAILLYSCISAYLRCHQRCLILQLMGVDAETHSQTLDKAVGTHRREGGRNVRVRGMKYPRRSPQYQLSRVHRISQNLKRQSWSLDGIVLRPLNMCYGHLA